MNCPCCGKEMEKGGIITGGVTAMWHPLAEFEKKGLKQLVYTGGKPIGNSSILFSQTKIPNAHYCGHCNKVVGIFDVADMN